MSLAMHALVVVASLAPSLRTLESEATGPHYRVVCHFENEAAAALALEVAESVYPFVAEFYGAGEDALEEKLELHLYSDSAAYETAEAALTGGQFKSNLTFSHWDSKSSHIALQPEVAPQVFEALGLSAQTLRHIAHEAAHTATYSLCPNFRSHPRWFAEGTTQWFEGRWARELEKLGEAEEDPDSATQMVHLQKLETASTLPTATQIVSGKDLELRFYETYAVDALFFAYMVKVLKPEGVLKLGREARRLGGGRGFTEKLSGVLAELKPLKKLDAGFARYVRALDPEWEQIYRSLETAGKEWVQLAGSKNAIAWRVRPIKKRKWTLSGSFEFLPGRARPGGNQLNVLLDRTDSGFIQLAFQEAGTVLVLEYDSRKDTWSTLARADAQLTAGVEHELRVSWKKGELSVQVGDEPPLETKIERGMDGPWGLGAYSGSAGVWRSIKLR